MSSKPFIIIYGPTASGKTALALHLAQELNTCVINADSRQLFKGLPILSAAPTTEETLLVPHILYDLYSWTQAPLDVTTWAYAATNAINASTSPPLLVGGTGFYLNVLMHGIPPVPAKNKTLAKYIRLLCRHSFAQSFLYKALKCWDPDITFHRNNLPYLERALCLALQTGKPPSSWKKKQPTPFTPHKPFIIKIEPPKEHVDNTIHNRAHQMVNKGLLEEVESFYQSNSIIPSILGFETVLQCVQGRITKEEMLQTLIIQTRQYAKRQLSYGRNHIKGHTIWPHLFKESSWPQFQKDFFPLWEKHQEACHRGELNS